MHSLWTAPHVIPEVPPRIVQHTRELARVWSLARRDPRPDPDITKRLTNLLRRSGSEMQLRPTQAQVLGELGMYGGAFAAIGVGGGKTLTSLLAPIMVGSKRPLLLLPAKLIDKTKREQSILSQHWRIPNHVRMMSYELLGRDQAARDIERYAPDLIIADEAHKLRNRQAACTKRVGRYMGEHPATRFLPLSGTMTKRSLKDYAHLLLWSLKPQGTPLPNSWSDLEVWSDLLDEHDLDRPAPGAFLLFSNGDAALPALREGWRRRFTDTPGVVAPLDKRISASLTVAPVSVSEDPAVDLGFQRLRTAWETLDGWAITEALEVWRRARELAVGFYYRWDPRPPSDWLEARRAWAHECRAILRNNQRQLDSEYQVTRAVEEGQYPGIPTTSLREWRAVEKSFTPNPVPEWLSQNVIHLCQAWAEKSPGIIWVGHTAFGHRLAEASGLPYYGRNGQDSAGLMIETHNPRKALIASIEANAEGRNLQAWSRNLVVDPPANGSKTEQLFGRTHREGQLEDTVEFDVVINCTEHLSGFWKSVADSRYVQQTTGHEQKLLYADILIPTVLDHQGVGPRWQ